jgi:hypothetical protein
MKKINTCTYLYIINLVRTVWPTSSNCGHIHPLIEFSREHPGTRVKIKSVKLREKNIYLYHGFFTLDLLFDSAPLLVFSDGIGFCWFWCFLKQGIFFISNIWNSARCRVCLIQTFPYVVYIYNCQLICSRHTYIMAYLAEYFQMFICRDYYIRTFPAPCHLKWKSSIIS